MRIMESANYIGTLVLRYYFERGNMSCLMIKCLQDAVQLEYYFTRLFCDHKTSEMCTYNNIAIRFLKIQCLQLKNVLQIMYRSVFLIKKYES